MTKFVFRKIEKPLDILISGVHEIQDGNLAYRIRYSNKDEFLPVCQDFNQMAERLQQSIVQTERKNETARN
ncbi:MAG: HAMP domain-containing protein [Ruminococcus callidus]